MDVNAIQKLQAEVASHLPTALSRLDAPSDPGGEWWIDFKYHDHSVSVQWSTKRGFGVTAPDPSDAYGEGAHETFVEYSQAKQRVLQLLQTGEHTSPPAEVALRELRSLAGLTQSELAQRLGIKQAAVSRLERRSDLTIRSLERFVVALGGELEISVRTHEGHVVRLGGLVESKASRAHCAHPLASSGGDADDQLLEIKPELDKFLDWLHEVSAPFRPSSSAKPQLQIRSHCALASAESSTNEISLNLASTWASVSRKLRKSCLVTDPHTRFVRACEFLIAHEAWHLYEDSFTDDFRRATGFENAELLADAFAGWASAMRAECDGSMFGAAVAGALGCREAHCSYPPPEERALAYMRGYSLGESRLEAACSNAVDIQLLVLRSRDLDQSRNFYSALGLNLRTEKHGAGPLHHSCDVGGTTLELYPRRSGDVESRVRLGMSVPSASAVLTALARGRLTSPPRQVERDGCAIWLVEDPDGNIVELSEGALGRIRSSAHVALRAAGANELSQSRRGPRPGTPNLSGPVSTAFDELEGCQT